MKKFSKCGVLKELSDFYKKGKNGYIHTRCRKCAQTSTHIWWNKNRVEALAKGRIYAAEKRKRIKDATFAAYGGNICACCGETEIKFLTLDHINNDGAAVRRSIYGNRNAAGYVTYAWLARRGFPPGYQILCMNCNHGKRMNNGVCPHKTRCNDHPLMGVESSDSKRLAPILKIVG